ncbi:hypothetical protein ZWY2020_055545 [Hordeum vulgare]|nr:hypothetical protein ZWY2020_055545 [Hordeum vulgare]
MTASDPDSLEPPAGATIATTTQAAPGFLTPSHGTTTPTTMKVASASLSLPSMDGAVAAFHVFRKADPAMRGHLQPLRPSTTKMRASSDLGPVTPMPTTLPVTAAEDDGPCGAPFVGPDSSAASDTVVRTPAAVVGRAVGFPRRRCVQH